MGASAAVDALTQPLGQASTPTRAAICEATARKIISARRRRPQINFPTPGPFSPRPAPLQMASAAPTPTKAWAVLDMRDMPVARFATEVDAFQALQYYRVGLAFYGEDG